MLPFRDLQDLNPPNGGSQNSDDGGIILHLGLARIITTTAVGTQFVALYLESEYAPETTRMPQNGPEMSELE